MANENSPRIVVLGFENIEKMVDGKLVSVPWVTYAPAHSVQNTQTQEAVHRLKPNDKVRAARNSTKNVHMQAIWDQIEPRFDAWLAGETLTEDGTDLSYFKGLNKASQEVLHKSGITSVEALTEMTDTQCDKIQLPNMRKTRQQAIKFLESLDANAATEKSNQQDAKMAEMQDRMDAMTAMLEQTTPKKVELSGDIMDLRAQCDNLGIEYHHKAGVSKLQELVNQAA